MSKDSLDVRGRRIRRAVAQLTEGSRRRYPVSLRSQIAELARARLEGGCSRAAVCEELGVSSPSLTRMLTERSLPLRRVRVIATKPAMVPVAAAGVVVRCPGGVVVEGLDTAGVVALVRALT